MPRKSFYYPIEGCDTPLYIRPVGEEDFTLTWGVIIIGRWMNDIGSFHHMNVAPIKEVNDMVDEWIGTRTFVWNGNKRHK